MIRSKHVFVVETLERFYDPSRIQLIHPPVVLSSSLAKQLYGSPFSAMFEASGRAGSILQGSGSSVTRFQQPIRTRSKFSIQWRAATPQLSSTRATG